MKKTTRKTTTPRCTECGCLIETGPVVTKEKKVHHFDGMGMHRKKAQVQHYHQNCFDSIDPAGNF